MRPQTAIERHDPSRSGRIWRQDDKTLVIQYSEPSVTARKAVHLCCRNLSREVQPNCRPHAQAQVSDINLCGRWEPLRQGMHLLASTP